MPMIELNIKFFYRILSPSLSLSLSLSQFYIMHVYFHITHIIAQCTILHALFYYVPSALYPHLFIMLCRVVYIALYAFHCTLNALY